MALGHASPLKRKNPSLTTVTKGRYSTLRDSWKHVLKLRRKGLDDTGKRALVRSIGMEGTIQLLRSNKKQKKIHLTEKELENTRKAGNVTKEKWKQLLQKKGTTAAYRYAQGRATAAAFIQKTIIRYRLLPKRLKQETEKIERENDKKRSDIQKRIREVEEDHRITEREKFRRIARLEEELPPWRRTQPQVPHFTGLEQRIGWLMTRTPEPNPKLVEEFIEALGPCKTYREAFQAFEKLNQKHGWFKTQTLSTYERERIQFQRNSQKREQREEDRIEYNRGYDDAIAERNEI